MTRIPLRTQDPGLRTRGAPTASRQSLEAGRAGGGRLGGERANRIRDRIVARYDEMVRLLVESYMANGFPPFTTPETPYEQYQKLLAMRGAGDPQFWDSPQAQATLNHLEARFASPYNRQGAP